MASKQGGDQSLLKQFLASGIAQGSATACTHPLDTVKVRLQLHPAESPGMLSTAGAVTRQEGIGALYRGVHAAVARSFLVGAVRLGTYPTIKSAFGAEAGKDVGFGTKVASGSTAGILAALAGTPSDLIKTRMQMKGSRHAEASQAEVATHIVKRTGLAGLWKGALPSAARTGIFTAAQVGVYDESKHRFMKTFGTGSKDVVTQFGASLISGLVTTTAVAPADIIKTRMFADGHGLVHTARGVAAKEGLRGFFKGWLPSYVRIGPQTTLSFLVLEALRSAFGLQGF